MHGVSASSAHRRHHTARRAAMRRCTKANARASPAAGLQAPTGDGDGARRMARSCSGRLSECTQALCSKTTRTCDERSHAAEGAQNTLIHRHKSTRTYECIHKYTHAHTCTGTRARTKTHTNTHTHKSTRARTHTPVALIDCSPSTLGKIPVLCATAGWTWMDRAVTSTAAKLQHAGLA